MRYTRHNVMRGEDGRIYQAKDWRDTAGAVYLLRCLDTGEYKYGGSTNPLARIETLAAQAQAKLGRNLVYVWSIVTNGVGRLESSWTNRWGKFRADKRRREWVILPDNEVAHFRSFVSVVWKDGDPLPDDLREDLSALPDDHRLRRPWRRKVYV